MSEGRASRCHAGNMRHLYGRYKEERTDQCIRCGAPNPRRKRKEGEQ
jgi:hypothetical protein